MKLSSLQVFLSFTIKSIQCVISSNLIIAGKSLVSVCKCYQTYRRIAKQLPICVNSLKFGLRSTNGTKYSRVDFLWKTVYKKFTQRGHISLFSCNLNIKKRNSLFLFCFSIAKDMFVRIQFKSFVQIFQMFCQVSKDAITAEL